MKTTLLLCVALLHIVAGQYYDLTSGPQNLSQKLQHLNSEAGQAKIVAKTNAVVREPVLSQHVARAQDDTPITITVNQIPFANLQFVTDNVVFGLDAYGRVWVSQDGFMHWNQTSVDSNDRIRGIYPSPVENGTVLFLGGISRNPTNASWITRDYGNTYQRIQTSMPMSTILWHPTEKGWALGVSGRILYMTKDYTATWVSIRDRLTFATWCHAGQFGIPEDRICMITDVTADELGLPSGTTDGRVGPSRFVRTEDLGDTIEVMFSLRVSYLLIQRRFFMVLATDPSTGLADLFVSKDHGNTWHNAILPADVNVPYLYPEQILAERFGAIWIGVVHSDPVYGQSMAGNIYVSDTDGYTFSAALTNVVNLNNWWDFEIVSHMEGTYLANVMVNYRDDQNDATNQIEQMIKTLVTYDNGRTWQSLQAPDFDSNGVPVNCTGRCSLNLFGMTTWLGQGGNGFYGPFYTAPDAIGLIMATGNPTTFLDFDEEDVNTYMSRDGGASWIEITKGSTVYEYGDKGGILGVVRNQVPTSTFMYSLNEGKDWITVNFTAPNRPMTVINMFTTSTSAEKFVLFGWVLGQITYIGIDMSALQERTCDINSDYEKWSPKQSRNATDDCVLGRDIVYLRRKRDAECFSPDNLKQVVNVTHCSCTTRDYECDYGYQRTWQSYVCAKVMDSGEESQYIMQQCADSTNGMYNVSSGYRLIPGDSCINPLPQYQPTSAQCPVTPQLSTGSTTHSQDDGHVIHGLSGGSVAGLVFGFIVVAALAVLFGVCLGAKSEKIYNLVNRKKTGPSYAKVWHDDEDNDNRLVDDE